MAVVQAQPFRPARPRRRWTVPESQELALTARANNISIISTDRVFAEQFCKVHNLSDYKTQYAPASLITNVKATIDCLLFDANEFDEEGIGL
jgi:hypothetical protein